MKDRKWEEAVKLRGISFKRNLETYRMLTRIQPPKISQDGELKAGYRLAVIHCGAPCCGKCFSGESSQICVSKYFFFQV